MTSRCSLPTPKTPPSTSASTSPRPRGNPAVQIGAAARPPRRLIGKGYALVREERREVLHRRLTHALLERRAGQLGARRRAVRQGLDRVLPRLPGAGSEGDPLADREVPEVLRRRPDEGRLRGRVRGRGGLPAHLPQGV